MNPKIISIYSGAGGIDLGFHKVGFDIVYASDIWDIACETLKINFDNTEVACDSICNINFNDLQKKYEKIDGLIGGPPCPPFSKSRFYRTEKQRGIEDKDGYMTLNNYIRAIKELKPSFFLFENVHGFIYKPHEKALKYLQSETNKLGYNLSFKVINTANYGIPQTRERFICIGTLKSLKPFVFPKETHAKPAKLNGDDISPWVTAGDVLNDIDFDLPEDVKMQAGSKHSDLLKMIPPGDNYLYFTKKRGHPEPQFKWRSRYWSFLLKLSPTRPSWTIQASHSNNMGPFHWKNRYLRVSEIKRLQTFDDNYNIHGSYKEQWRQIGNAVPPLLSEILATQIKALYYK